MSGLRSIVAIAAFVAAGSGTALAGSWADCHRPPPAWYTAPRVSYTYSNSYGAGYAHGSTHEYSAQRRYSSSRWHSQDTHRRW